jgi:DNA-binding response OmpR family regulator
MPNLILLDMRMPVMDGRTFVARFRERYPTYVPILLLTGVHDAGGSVEDLGAAGALEKPFDLDLLVAKIEALLQPPDPSIGV